MVKEGLGELNLSKYFSLRNLAGEVPGAAMDFVWDNRGNIAGAVLGAGILALTSPEIAFAQDGGPDGENIVGPLGEAGIWLGRVVERAAKNPLEIIVPMFATGLSYGIAQGIWKTFRREAPVEPEQSPVFHQALRVALQNGMELDDPAQKRAFAATLAAFRIVPSGGQQAPFLEELWEEVKELAPKEAGEWTGAGIWLYVTLNLMESTSRMPADAPWKYGQFLVTAIAAGYALRELKNALTPSKK